MLPDSSAPVVAIQSPVLMAVTRWKVVSTVSVTTLPAMIVTPTGIAYPAPGAVTVIKSSSLLAFKVAVAAACIRFVPVVGALITISGAP